MASPSPILPRVRARRTGPDLVLTLDLDPALAGFQGHFPGDPILPGVVQVDWAARFGAEAFGPLAPFRGLSQVKFHRTLRPGQSVDLHLAFDPDRGRLQFAYQQGAETVSRGALLFGTKVAVARAMP